MEQFLVALESEWEGFLKIKQKKIQTRIRKIHLCQIFSVLWVPLNPLTPVI